MKYDKLKNSKTQSPLNTMLDNELLLSLLLTTIIITIITNC
jgi:hypothetical protein